MPWWIWITLIVIVLIVIVRFLRAPRGYMGRSQKRLKQAEKLMKIVERGIYDHLDPNHQKELEDELLALAQAQKREDVTDDALILHRDRYATLMQFQWEKLNDLRLHGGANLDAIVDAEDTFVAKTVEEDNRARQDRNSGVRWRGD